MRLTRHPATVILAAALVTALVTSAVATAVVAAEDDGVIVDLLDGEDDGLRERVSAYAAGLYNRLTDGGTGDTTDEEAADALRTTFNDRAGSIQAWVNNRSSALTGADVLEIEIDVDEDGGGETVYLVADVNGSNYENGSIVETTEREPDESCTLEAEAAANASDELERFHDEIVEPGEEYTRSYENRLKAQYAGQVSCSFLRE